MGKKPKAAANFWDEDEDDGTSTSTDLHALVNEGNNRRIAHVLKRVKKYEIDVDQVDNEGRTPLMIACMRGNAQIVSFLMQANACPDLKDHEGYAAVHHATLASGNKFVGIARASQCLRALLKYHAEIDRKTADGRTAVHVAVQNECMDVIMVLRDLKADLNKFSTEGLNAIYYACVNAAKDKSTAGVVSIIRLGAKVDCKDPITRKTALHVASEEKLAEICRFLVLSKANIGEKDRQGNTPLHNVVQTGSLQTLQAIIDALMGDARSRGKGKGGKIDEETEKQLAAMTDDANKAKLQHVLSLTDRKGNTALHIACSYGFYDIASYLLRKGADASVTNLPFAAIPVDRVVVDLGHKVKKKARKKKDEEGESPLPKASNDEENGMKTPYHVCCEVGHSQIFKMMVNRGIDTTAKDESGRTCLHYAAMNNDVEIATLQLDNTMSPAGKMYPSPKTKAGWTPMHFAAAHDSVHVIVLLLEAGAPITSKNKEGNTPLDMATRSRTKKALLGQLKEVLEQEAMEKELRLKAMVDERKKKMVEMQKEAEERSKHQRLLVSPRSDDEEEEEEEDPLARKKKAEVTDVERPGSRASSGKGGTGSHRASRHERASPRSSETGSRPGTAGTGVGSRPGTGAGSRPGTGGGSRPGTGASRPDTNASRPETSTSNMEQRDHPPGYDQPFQRMLWQANKKLRPVVNGVERKLQPVTDALMPYWEHPGFVKGRRKMKRFLIKAKRKTFGGDLDTESLMSSRATSLAPSRTQSGVVPNQSPRGSLPNIHGTGTGPGHGAGDSHSRPGTSDNYASALKKPGPGAFLHDSGPAQRDSGPKKKVAFGGEVKDSSAHGGAEGTKLPRVRIPKNKL